MALLVYLVAPALKTWDHIGWMVVWCLMQGHEGVVHADYEGLAPYPQKLFDPDTRAYSAVLSLAMAASGGNLENLQEHQLANEEPLLCDQKVSEVAYKVGTMTIFDSFCYHRHIGVSQLDDDHPL